MATPKKESNILGWLATFATIAFFTWLFIPDRFEYAFYYHVDPGQVHVQEFPKDCDFMHAPLGDKACHYKKIVTAYNGDGALVIFAGDTVQCRQSVAGTNNVTSYDEGKTWDALPDGKPCPDTRVKTVEITWTRVEE